ncbi:MAG TPA: SGNH/GDSL hydrolase family protein [Candidatus Handelsmanbacteria bacterium]|nr:SGNH/GDSL hydrolase family protein [Candidatus Handelsmanbacteria bacterium]
MVDELLRMEASNPLVSAIESTQGADGTLRAFLSEHSRLVGVLRSMRDSWRGSPWDRYLAQERHFPDRIACFERGRIRTVMTPSYRKVALNLDDARISEGLRIAIHELGAMARRCAESDTAFGALLIPTKEYVFSNQLTTPEELGTGYSELIQLERRMWEQAESFLFREEITYVSVLTPLSSPLDKGLATYRETSDGHPSPLGHQCMAEAAQEIVAQSLPGRTTTSGR